MKIRNWIAALAACSVLPVFAQSTSHSPTAAEARQARENAARDAKLADAMEKARLKEEAKPVSVYIPAEKVEPASTNPASRSKVSHPEVFTATVPGSKKAAKQKSPKKRKTA